MPDELETCLASIFLNKGKDVLITKEFTMYASLDLRWMPNKDADALMHILIDKGLMSKTDDYLRPTIDVSSVNVPVAYRPSEDLLKVLKDYSPKQPSKKKDAASDLFPRLIQKAIESGMGKGAFISECNKVSKRTDVSIEVAALMILREKGVDIMPFVDDVRSSVTCG
jgi:hypothetical protein